jgi:hypothetical protein
MNLNLIMKHTGKFLSDNSPLVLTALGVTGTLATAYLSGVATFKAAELIAEKEHDFGNGISFRYGPRDKAELVWKLYIPAATSAAVTIAAIIYANRIGTRRAAAVAALYSVSEKAFDEYRKKIVERVGVKKEQSYRDEVAQDRVTRDPVTSREVIITGNGEVLCYESFTGRYFNSDMETIRRAMNDINYRVMNDSYAALSDFYFLIGLPQTAYSDEVGWNADKLLEIQFSTTLSDDGRPCISVEFVVAPVRHYHRLS